MNDMRLPDDEDTLDNDFPLGDGTAETGATVYCPYCNETVEIVEGFVERNLRRLLRNAQR